MANRERDPRSSIQNPKSSILIVEDEAIIAAHLERILGRLGYDVAGMVASGEEALQKVEETTPDLVLMDIKLVGGLDGIEAAAQVRDRFGVPVVYLTGYAEDMVIQQAKITGPYGYLAKPVQERELRATIEMALYRHKLETQLREKERWLDTTLRSIGDAVMATDRRGRVTFMNPVAEKLTGWQQEKALGRDLGEVFHIIDDETTGDLAENPVLRVTREGAVVGLAGHALLINKDGTSIPIDDSGAPIWDDDRNITGVVLVFRDVTGRVRAEDALRESEERFREILEHSQDALYKRNLETGRYEYMSPAIVQITGFTPDEVMAMSPGEIDAQIHPEDIELLSDLRRKLFETPQGLELASPMEYRVKCKDGNYRWISDHYTLLRGPEGRPLFSVATVRDITERKRAEEALQWRNQELTLLNRAGRAFNSTLDLEQVLIQVLGTVRDLLEVLDSSIWLLDKETDELVCRYLSNSQSEGIRGWRLSLGQGIAGWTAKNGQSALVLDTREDPRHFEGVDQHIGREIRSLLAVPLWDQQAVFGVLEVVDTKPRRFAVADRQVIESLAATASIAIQNARLYAQTQQDAETKATLLREVNHRVGNNLAAIVGLLDLERKRAKVNSQAAYEAVMEDLVSRIHGLATAHHLLSAAEWSPLLLSELVKEVIDTGLQTLPLGEYVSVEVSSSPVRVTPRQANNLALVVNELTTNSAKHAWETRRARQIAVRIDGQDDAITLEFRDNGVGYPEEVLRLERHGVGWGLIQSLVGHSLQGEMALHNDGGAVTTLRFPAIGSGGSLTRRERKEGLN